MRRIISSLLLSATFLDAMSYATITGRLDDSAIYPATSHSFTVTVPDQYDASEPAALYLGLDGILCNAPDVIDTLIASGQMPVTIGVFLQPGVVKDSCGNILRYNRSNEFDAIDGTFARFLETELLPAVQTLKLDDGRQIKITENPDKRMIFGLSSGGIAAFAAAWNRPDLFRRVFSGCGTFVPMRGGNEIQALVRKHEPKPLKIFLQDGFSDSWNQLFGSWFAANAMLGTALEFAGYDCAFDWIEGDHSVRRATEIFTDVMTWIWTDFQSPVKSGKTGIDMLRQLLIEDSDWIKTDRQIHADTAATYPDRTMRAYRDKNSDWVRQQLFDNDGKAYADQRFYWLHSPHNNLLKTGGMSFDGDGNLWVLTDAGLQICDQNGRVRAILSLPHDFDVSTSGIIISDGMVEINGYVRALNAKSPVVGVRPDSQGQG